MAAAQCLTVIFAYVSKSNKITDRLHAQYYKELFRAVSLMHSTEQCLSKLVRPRRLRSHLRIIGLNPTTRPNPNWLAALDVLVRSFVGWENYKTCQNYHLFNKSIIH